MRSSYDRCTVMAVQEQRSFRRDRRIVPTPFTTHHVLSADGTGIGYRSYGAGPGVVLVHGGMMAAQGLDVLARELSAWFTVSVPDLRGRGMSGPFRENDSILTEVEDL